MALWVAVVSDLCHRGVILRATPKRSSVLGGVLEYGREDERLGSGSVSRTFPV